MCRNTNRSPWRPCGNEGGNDGGTGPLGRRVAENAPTSEGSTLSATLAKGQNGPLNTDGLVISVQLTAPADLSALLVTDRGKVRTDADFVFYNQPIGPGVRLVPGPAGQSASLSIDLNQIPADIDQIRAVITLDDASSSFGAFAPPTAIVSDTAGTRLYEYRIDGLDRESIVIALEVYRRQGAWKVRAVGQGYAGGFAALVTDHGVNVDSPAPQQSAPAQAPPPPTQQVPPAQYGHQAGYPPQGGYPPPTQQYPPQGGYPPPTQQYPQGAPAPSGEISLRKDRPVSLQKGQRVTLRKEGGTALTFVKMGLGWDPVTTRGMFGNRTVDI